MDVKQFIQEEAKKNEVKVSDIFVVKNSKIKKKKKKKKKVKKNY